MTIPEIAKKYKISESFLNSKDDAHMIAATSILDLKQMVLQNHPSDKIAEKLQFIANFLIDVKNSNY
jgi:hypothetical protein